MNPQLVEQLKAFARKGSTFEQAKKALMDAGWTEDEVAAADDQFPYIGLLAGSDNPSSADAQLKQAYADAILSASVTKQQESFKRDRMRPSGGIVASTNTHEKDDWFITWDLNIPWWVYYPGLFGLYGLAFVWDVPILLTILVIAVLVALREWQQYPRYKKPKDRG